MKGVIGVIKENKMKIDEYFSKEELEKANNIMVNFYDKLLLDKKIDNVSALILSIYMICNKSESSLIPIKDVKELFINMGRKKTDFSKTLYDLSGKRKGKDALIIINKDSMSLNFEGLNRIKMILGDKNG